MPDFPHNKHLAIIRVAKQQVGMSDEDYRALLVRLTGSDSAKALTPATFKKLMEHLEKAGFRSSAAKKDAKRHPLKASEAQLRKIEGLWDEFTDGTGTETSLRRWMDNRGYGASPTWLDADTARKVIGALTNMVSRKLEKEARHG